MGQGEGTGRTVALKVVVLAVSLVLAGAAIYFVADWFRKTILHESSDGIGGWIALLGGGMAVWAFFLIQSGIAQQTLELVAKAKTLWNSVWTPDWAPFMGSLGDFMRTAVYPGIATVFALVFGIEVKERAATREVEPKHSELAERIDVLDDKLDSNLKSISDKLGGIGGRAAEANPDQRGSDYHYFRFPISFEQGSLDESLATLDAGIKVSERGQGLIEYLAKALLPCGDATGKNPVILKVEGYASSQPFQGNPKSNEWNVNLANARRQTVAQMLRDKFGSENEQGVVVCESADYQSLGEMERERQFDDRPVPGDSEDQYLFTRSAHIKVLHLGRCEMSKYPSADSSTGLTPTASECLDKARLRRDRGTLADSNP